MAYVFYVLGTIAVVVGLIWSVIVIALPNGDTSFAVMAKFAVASPGLGILFSGLLMLAIGSGLHRLGRIARNGDDTVRLLETMLR